jgi:hypothetical protein
MTALLQVLRGGLVGALAIAAHAVVAVAVNHWLHLPPVVANGLGFCVAHSTWLSFQPPKDRTTSVHHTAVAICTIVVASVLVFAVQRLAGAPPGLYLPVMALATAFIEWLFQLLWTFRHAEEKIG